MTQHVYNHTGKSSDGFDIFECPTCGRKVALRWPPQYKKIELVRGSTVAHVFGQGGLTVDSEGTQADPYLAPFDAWMQGHDDPASQG